MKKRMLLDDEPFCVLVEYQPSPPDEREECQRLRNIARYAAWQARMSIHNGGHHHKPDMGVRE